MTGNVFSTTGVWWDINTCPVPDGYDPGLVAPSIETTLSNFHALRGPNATIFCVGNLESVSPQVLKQISSSGVHIRHAPLGAIDLYHLLHEWKEYALDPPEVMLISGDASWFSDSIRSLGYTILRAFPDPHPVPFQNYKPYKQYALYTIREGLVWERVLKETNPRLADTNNQIFTDLPAWSCTLCEIPSQSCDDFINHIESTEHKKELKDSLFVKDNPVLFCKLCKDRGEDVKNMTMSEEHAHNVSSLSIGRFERLHMAQGFHVKTTTGVWWDINTCPIPDGFDPRCVRPSIESALKKYLGPDRPVTIFCVGNLEYISPQVLKDISSSGILIRQTLFRGMALSNLLDEWKEIHPPPAATMLISSDSSWFNDFSSVMGYVLLRAYPNPRLPFGKTIPPAKEWVWESLLKENLVDSGPPVKTNSQIVLKDEHALFCTQCDIPSHSCDDFMNHLKSTEHREKLWRSVGINWNGIPAIFCELCEYPGYDLHSMTIHLTSEEHAQKVFEYELANEFHGKDSSLDTTQVNLMNKKRTHEEDLLNEVNKKSAV